MDRGGDSTPFLTFSNGEAEQAVNLAAQVIPDSRIELLDHYRPSQPGPDGKLYPGMMTIAGSRHQRFDWTSEPYGIWGQVFLAGQVRRGAMRATAASAGIAERHPRRSPIPAPPDVSAKRPMPQRTWHAS